MTKKIKISEIPEFDAAEYLTSDEEVAAYLTTILEENDAALLAAALGHIARAGNDAGCRGLGHHAGSLVQSA
jgi:probable addiction module antidote protein